MPHSFIFKPGLWRGSGILTFSMAEDKLDFETTWRVLAQEDEKIYFHQTVDVKEFPEAMSNHFYIDEIKENSFAIHLENDLIGKAHGKGVISPTLIAWEFREKGQEFEGFEIYELQEDGSYSVRAEFSAGEGFRTYVQARIEKEIF